MFWFQIVKSEPGTRSNRIFGDASSQHEEIPKTRTGRGIRDCENERFVEE